MKVQKKCGFPTFIKQSRSMRALILFAVFVCFVFTAMAQKPTFIEQVGGGYTTGTNPNSFSPSGNGGGFAFESACDFLLHDLVGLGFGFDIDVIRLNGRNASIGPVFADFKLVAKGQFRPYLVIDPGYCFYTNSIADGTTQKGGVSFGSGAGLWFPSKRFLHLFLQAKYNYTRIATSTKGIPGNSSGSIGTFNFLIGYKF
jgi:hypothetical protein